MRQIRLLLLMLFLLSGVTLSAYAGDRTLEDRFSAMLAEEAAKGSVRAAVLDFSVSSADPDAKISDNGLKDIGRRSTEQFTEEMIDNIKAAGKADRITMMNNAQLRDTLREKKLRVTEIDELSVVDIGTLAGIDVVITGHVQVHGDSRTLTARMVRISDGTVLGTARKLEQPKGPDLAVLTLVEGMESLKIGARKTVALSLPYSGTLDVSLEVMNGNAVDIYVVPASELQNINTGKEFQDLTAWRSLQAKKYTRSDYVRQGTYYLVLHDISLGLFSSGKSDIHIRVQLKP